MSTKYIQTTSLATILIFSLGCEEWHPNEYIEIIPPAPCGDTFSNNVALTTQSSFACNNYGTFDLFPYENTILITELAYKTSDLHFEQIAQTNSLRAEKTTSLPIPLLAEYKLDLISGRVTFQKYDRLYSDLETIQTIECPISSKQATKLRSLSNKRICQTQSSSDLNRMMCYEEHSWISANIQNYGDLRSFRSSRNYYSACSDLYYNYTHFCDGESDALLGEIVNQLNISLRTNACPDLSVIE